MRPFLIALTVALAALMANIDETIVNVAAPVLMSKFGTDTSGISSIALAYLVAMVSTVLMFGKLGDAYGKRRVFLTGFWIFTFASALCGLSRTLAMLVASRLIQGVGAAALFSTTGAIIMKDLPENHRGKAFSMVSILAGAGAAMGAPAGGFIIHHFDWRFVFFVNVPIGILGIVFVHTLIQKDPPRASDFRFDYAGAVFSTLSVAFLIVALNQGSELGWLSWKILACLAGFSLFALLFVKQERQAAEPILHLELLRQRQLRSALAARGAVTASLTGISFLFPFYLQLVKDMPPDKTGYFLAVSSVLMLVTSPLSGYLVDRAGADAPARVSMLLMTGASIGFLFFRASTSSAYILSMFALYGISLGLFFTANIKTVMSQGEKGKEGMITAVNAFNSFLSTALGIVIFETVYSFHFPIVRAQATSRELLVLGFFHAAALCVLAKAAALIFSLRTSEKREPALAPQ